MPQIINGLILGAPGPAGSRPIYILQLAEASPDVSADTNLNGAQLGSIAVAYTVPALFFKTDLTTSPAHPNGVWTQVAVP